MKPARYAGLWNPARRLILSAAHGSARSTRPSTRQGQLPELEQLWTTIASKNMIVLSPQAQRVADLVIAVEAVLRLPPLLRPLHLAGLYNKYRATGPLPDLMSILGALDRTPVTALLQPVLDVNKLKRSLVVTGTNLNLQTSESFFAFVGSPGATTPVEDAQETFIASTKLAHAITAENYLTVKAGPARFMRRCSSSRCSAAASATSLFAIWRDSTNVFRSFAKGSSFGFIVSPGLSRDTCAPFRRLYIGVALKVKRRDRKSSSTAA